MAIHLTQVTIGAAAAQPTRFTTAHTPCYHVIVEADDGNSNACWIGDSGLASNGSEGIRLNNSATAPGRMEVGPFSAQYPINLMEFYVAGTEGEKVNVLYVQ